MSHNPARNLRRRLREIPLLAYCYHRLREALAPWRARMAPTPYGFSLAGHSAMQQGTFESEEIELMRQLIAGSDMLVDVGANIGLYTCLARALGCHAIAVEPLAANLKLLRANLEKNGWADTEIVAAGLAAQPGSAKIFGTDTGASLLPGWSGLSRRTLLTQVIPLTTLDDLLRGRFEGERLLVKVDIEGGEYALLRGATRTLERVPAPVWLVEICLTENFPETANPHYADTFAMFFERGYSAWTANAARRPVTREDVAGWAAQLRCDSGTYNYLFIHGADTSRQ